MRGDQRAHALVVEQPADEADGYLPGWLGHRCELIGIDPGAGDEEDAIRTDAERGDGGAVVIVLHQHRCAWTVEQETQQAAHNETGGPRFRRFRREGEAQPCKGIQCANWQAERCERADDGWLQRNVMHKIGLHLAINPPHVADEAQTADGIGAAAPPGQRMQLEAKRLDGCAIGLHTGGHMHLIAGALGGQRHGQPVRAEIPVLGNQIE